MWCIKKDSQTLNDTDNLDILDFRKSLITAVAFGIKDRLSNQNIEPVHAYTKLYCYICICLLKTALIYFSRNIIDYCYIIYIVNFGVNSIFE